MSKASILAPANIAVIKYWGARDLDRTIPCNSSISMTLKECRSHTTVEVRPAGEADQIFLALDSGLEPAPLAFRDRAIGHLQQIRQAMGAKASFRVATRNSFPSASGMASSASGFSALAMAATQALGTPMSLRELSVLARLSGSGSASRSVYGGWVEWSAEEKDGAAIPLYDAAHFPLVDAVAIVESGAKEISSLEGHRRAIASPHFERRLELLPHRLQQVRQALDDRDIHALGRVMEEEAIELHLIAMSSKPPVFYWQPATIAVHRTVWALREEGFAAYFTMDAGANVHVLCPPEEASDVAIRLGQVEGVEKVIVDRTGDGPMPSAEHLL